MSGCGDGVVSRGLGARSGTQDRGVADDMWSTQWASWGGGMRSMGVVQGCGVGLG